MDGIWHIFKQSRPGEDWSEKVACELASWLAIPHATVEFARCGETLGVASPTFVPTRAALIHGNELLLNEDPDYPAEQRWKVSKHTLHTVLAALELINPDPPINYPGQGHNWVDVFAGYLLLDALIGNTDRHHENWALVRTKDKDYLAPTYDHAASLGRNEPDAKRLIRLSTADKQNCVGAYANRARSAFYQSEGDAKPMSTLDVFVFMVRRYPRVLFWLDRLREVQVDHFQALLARLPDGRISDPARQFALAMLQHNRERLLALAK